uniref:Uncharacterized protein LOC104211256 n=1 Tax=Nicotiana sylvestris TaxID=4096 RepID=A0A1U7V8K8_NICSY|nr:PREDICTED: uncharacterized protein LOC104211256 [Nicotiana sylvestris]
MEFYINDMLVKSLNACDCLKHLQETFDILRKHNMKLNPEKCAFGVSSAIKRKRGSKVDRVTGRFEQIHFSVFGEMPSFFSLLKKKNNFEWTPQCQQALKDLKRYLSSPPLLSKPEEGKQLLIYLAVSEVAVNVVLVREDKGSLAKWAVEMSEFDIDYKPRTAIKSQFLADFVVDFSLVMLPLATKEAVIVSESTSGVWTLFTDGASNVKGSGLGIMLTTPSGETPRQAIRTVPLTNSEVEYEALIAGLELARELDYEVYRIFEAKEERMQPYVVKVQALHARFKEWSTTHIPREENAEEDTLSNLGSSTEMNGSESSTVIQIMHSVLDVDSYYEVNATNLVWEWKMRSLTISSMENFLKIPRHLGPLRTKAARYNFKGGQLYRRYFKGPLARCLGTFEANYVMREAHEGICENHSGTNS